VGIGSVPDQRVDDLIALFKPKKIRYAEIEWVLFPALPADDKARKVWLDECRELDGLCYVVRQFTDPGVYHEDGSVDAARDVEKLDLELAFADLAVIEKRLGKLAKDNTKKTAVEREKQIVVLKKLKDGIEAERPVREIVLTPEEATRLGGLKFLSHKECMLVLNVDDDLAADEGALSAAVGTLPGRGRVVIAVSTKIEAELAEIEDPAERAEFLSDLGLKESGAARMAQAALGTLGLMPFFTVGPDEVRAWLAKRGATGPEAAGVIHTDFERGFIRAEVMRPEELLAAGSEAKLKEQGKVALKGKDYIVQDGDIVHILSGV
jgi:GTP-binding protein YchF